MKDLVGWLIGLEEMAGNLYAEAAIRFAEDAEFSSFLSTLGEDEAWHFHIMASAAEYMRTHNELIPPAITPDAEARKQIQAPLLQIYDRLPTGEVTKHEMLECILLAEFAEWNDFFQYVVNALKNRNRQFMQVAAKIQQHRESIERYMSTVPGAEDLLQRVRGLPEVWEKRVLVVEDSSLVANLLAAVCKKLGTVDIAWDGREGLKKATETYYDVIISDIEMPHMDGMEFFRTACEMDKSLGERFLFFTGHLTAERIAFFVANEVRYLSKPADLNELRDSVVAIMQQQQKPVYIE